MTLRFRGRWLSIGRSETTRGDGVSWHRIGLWFYGKGDLLSAGGRRTVTLEYDPGASSSRRQKTVDVDGHFR